MAYFVLYFQSECAKIRRQKELELEVLTTAIRDWEGEHISTLGDVLHLGAVSIVVPATVYNTAVKLKIGNW